MQSFHISTVSFYIASPTFDPEEFPSCMVLEGKTAQIRCISIGYPIRSRIIRKDVVGDGKDACQPINSTTNNATVGTTPFGKLNHTCNNVSLAEFGNNEFVCEVAFLSWGPNLMYSFTINHSFYCNVTKGKHRSGCMLWIIKFCAYIYICIALAENGNRKDKVSDDVSSKMVDNHILSNSSSSVIGNLSDTSIEITSIVIIIPLVIVVIVLLILAMFGIGE